MAANWSGAVPRLLYWRIGGFGQNQSYGFMYSEFMTWKYWLYAAIPLAFIIAEAFAKLDREAMEGVNLLLLKLAIPYFIAWTVNVTYTLRGKETEDVLGKVFVTILWILLFMMPFDLPY